MIFHSNRSKNVKNASNKGEPQIINQISMAAPNFNCQPQ